MTKSKSITRPKKKSLRLSYDFLTTILAPELPTESLISFSMTNRFFRDVFQTKLKRRTLNELTKRVAWGDQDGAEKIIKCNPKILLGKGGAAPDVFSRPGMGINGDLTVLQVALRVGDLDMCKMMKPYFELFPYGLKALQQQFDEFFREGYDAHIKKQQKAAFSFSKITNAIINATDEDVKACSQTPNNTTLLGRALEDFRDQLTQKVLFDKVFNPYHLLQAMKAFWGQFEALETWGKRDLFCIQVIGFTQRFLTAPFAQAFVQGLPHLIGSRKPLQRSLKFMYPFGEIKEFSVTAGDINGLGFKYFAPGGLGRAGQTVRLCAASQVYRFFKELVQTKTIGFQSLCALPRTPSVSVCN